MLWRTVGNWFAHHRFSAVFACELILESISILHSKKVEGAFATATEAIRFGTDRYGLGKFLVQECSSGDKDLVVKFYSGLQRVADVLHLELLRLRSVVGISGLEIRPVYTVSIGFAKDFRFSNLIVVGIQDLGGDDEALIGMDIINQLDFAITNLGGNTVHSIRFPSMGGVDFEVA